MRVTRRSLTAALGLAAVTPLAARQSMAQAFPSRPVRVLVGFPPGGSTDIFARAVAAALSEKWKQPVVVENRGGANGIIGTEALSRSAADGYTLMMTISSHVTNRPLYPNLSYNPLRDFTPLTLVARAPFVFVTHPAFPAQTLQDLIRLAREKPGEINYASPGTGSSQQLAVELFASMAGIKLNHVSYRGGAPALMDLVAGVIPVSLLTTTQVLPMVRDGRVRPLAVTTTGRSAVMPEVPTVAEAGVPGYDADVWFGLIASGGLAQDLVARIHADTAEVLAQPALRAQFTSQDATVINGAPDAFAALMRAEDEKWSRVIREANIRIE